MTPCTRHQGHCAFSGTEPDRCPRCHVTWAVILGCACSDCRTRENHEAVHDRRDAARDKKIRSKQAARDLVSQAA